MEWCRLVLIRALSSCLGTWRSGALVDGLESLECHVLPFFGILLRLDFDRSSLCLNAIILLKLNLLSRVPPMLARVRKCARSAWRTLLPLDFLIRFR